MSRHAAGPGVPAFQVSADVRGRAPKHRKTEKPRGRHQDKQRQQQPASAAA